MKISIAIGLICIFFLSCNKDKLPIGLYFQMYVNGKTTTIEACGSSAYVAEYYKDAALAIRISCGTGAGFYLKGEIMDGTYNLNDKSIAFYTPLDASGYKNYNTTHI